MAIFNQVVSGGGSAPAHYIEYSVDSNGNMTKGNKCISFNGVTSIGNSCLTSVYQGSSGITPSAIDMSSVQSINTSGCQYMFDNTTGITSVDMRNVSTIGNRGCEGMFQKSSVVSANLSSLLVISGNSTTYHMFSESQLASVDLSSLWKVSAGFGMTFDKTKLTRIDLPALEIIDNSGDFNRTFQNISTLTEATMPKLHTITSNSVAFRYAFQGCKLITFRFESLSVLTGSSAFLNMFDSNTTLEDVWFYALTPSSFGSTTTQFDSMLSLCTGVTVHFPIAIQSTIGSWTSVTAGFGGTNTTILYDIVTSLIGADTNTYTRSEKNSTATATAWTYNDTLYYTSGVSNHTAGVNEPTVGATIYSDSACTTAVTTISSIA